MANHSNQDQNRIHLELESLQYNDLNTLGDQAIAAGLIMGHGHHQGQYEILHRDQVILLPPKEAHQYLESLINSIETP